LEGRRARRQGMDYIARILPGIAGLLLAVGAAIVTLKPPQTDGAKWAWMAAFAVLGLMAIGATLYGEHLRYEEDLERQRVDGQRDQRLEYLKGQLDAMLHMGAPQEETKRMRLFARLVGTKRAVVEKNLALAVEQDRPSDPASPKTPRGSGIKSLRVRALSLSAAILKLMEDDFYAKRANLPERPSDAALEAFTAADQKLFDEAKTHYRRAFQLQALNTLRDLTSSVPPDQRLFTGSFDESELAKQVIDPRQPMDIIDVGEWLNAYAGRLDEK
jgi:hypothetical protein